MQLTLKEDLLSELSEPIQRHHGSAAAEAEALQRITGVSGESSPAELGGHGSKAKDPPGLRGGVKGP